MRKDFKKDIQDQVFNYESDVDLDQMWSDVKKEIFPRKRNPLFYLILPSLLCLCITGYFVFSNVESINENTLTEVSEPFNEVNNKEEVSTDISFMEKERSSQIEKPTNTSIETDQQNVVDTSIDKPLENSTDLSSIEEVPNEPNSKTSHKVKDEIIIPQINNATSSLLGNLIIEESNENTSSESLEISTFNTSISEVTPKTPNENNDQIAKPITSKMMAALVILPVLNLPSLEYPERDISTINLDFTDIQTNSNDIVNRVENAKTDIDNPAPNIDANESSKISQTNPIIKDESPEVITNESINDEIIELEKNPTKESVAEESTEEIITEVEEEEEIEPIQKIKKDRFTLSVITGLGVFLNRFENGNAQHEIKLDQTISSLEYTNNQLLLSYEVVNNLSINSGLSMTTYNERFEINEKYFVDQDGEVISGEKQDFIDEQPLSFGETTLVEQIENFGVGFNKIKIVEIPISLSYFNNLGRMRLEYSLGTSFVLSSYKEGYTINQSLVSETVNKDQLSKIKPSYFLAIGASWPITQSIHLKGQFNGNTRTIQSSNFDQKIISVGGSVGLGIRF